MPASQELEMDKKKYAKISLKKRQTLVQLVIEQNQSLTRTAKKLNIKLSTAKLILRKYRRTGEFFVKKMPPKVTNSNLEEIQQLQKGSLLQSKEQNQKKAKFLQLKGGFTRPQVEQVMAPMLVPLDINWLYYPWNVVAYSMII